MTLGECLKFKQNNRTFGVLYSTKHAHTFDVICKALCRYEEQRLSESSNRPIRVYLACVYYIIATLATVGYGDISADHAQERIVSVIIMLIGTIVFALIISTASMIVQVSA